MADGRTGVRPLSMEAHADARAVELAREGEARFRLLVEHSSDGLYLIGPDGHVSYASPPVERLLGFERSELTGRHFLDYLHPDDCDHAGWFFADVLSKPGVALRAALSLPAPRRRVPPSRGGRRQPPGRRRGRRRRRQLPRRHRAPPRRTGPRRERGSLPRRVRVGAGRHRPPRSRRPHRRHQPRDASRCSAISSRSCAAASSRLLIHEEEREQAQRDWRELADGGIEHCRAERRVVRRDGNPVWVNAHRLDGPRPARASALRHRHAREHHRAQADRGGAAGNEPPARRLGLGARGAAPRDRAAERDGRSAARLPQRRRGLRRRRTDGPASSFPRNRGRSASSAPAAAWSRPWRRGGRSTRHRSSRWTTAGRCAAVGPHTVDHGERGLVCKHAGELGASASICVPLLAQGELLGVLHLKVGAHGRSFDTRFRFVMTVAEHVSLAIANLKLRETLRSQSIRDPLTGLFNRRYMEESLEREMRRAARGHHPVGIIMLDLDDFKGFNDAHGHDAGDTLLRIVGDHAAAQRPRRGHRLPLRRRGIRADPAGGVAARRGGARRGDRRVGARAGHRASPPAGDRHHDLGRRRGLSRSTARPGTPSCAPPTRRSIRPRSPAATAST